MLPSFKDFQSPETTPSDLESFGSFNVEPAKVLATPKAPAPPKYPSLSARVIGPKVLTADPTVYSKSTEPVVKPIYTVKSFTDGINEINNTIVDSLANTKLGQRFMQPILDKASADVTANAWETTRRGLEALPNIKPENQQKFLKTIESVLDNSYQHISNLDRPQFEKLRNEGTLDGFLNTQTDIARVASLGFFDWLATSIPKAVSSFISYRTKGESKLEVPQSWVDVGLADKKKIDTYADEVKTCIANGGSVGGCAVMVGGFGALDVAIFGGWFKGGLKAAGTKIVTELPKSPWVREQMVKKFPLPENYTKQDVNALQDFYIKIYNQTHAGNYASEESALGGKGVSIDMDRQSLKKALDFLEELKSEAPELTGFRKALRNVGESLLKGANKPVGDYQPIGGMSIKAIGKEEFDSFSQSEMKDFATKSLNAMAKKNPDMADEINDALRGISRQATKVQIMEKYNEIVGRVNQGSVLYHGTSAPEFSSFKGITYLTKDPKEAQGFAEGVHLGGGTGGKARVMEVSAPLGKVKDIDDIILEDIFDKGMTDNEIVLRELGIAKTEGYDAISFTHPSNYTDGEFTAYVPVDNANIKIGKKSVSDLSNAEIKQIATTPEGRQMLLDFEPHMTDAEQTKIVKAIREANKQSPKEIKSEIEVFQGYPDLTTKILSRLEGKSVTSKQQILDFTNMPEVKQVEKDMIRRIVAEFPDTVPVKEFADRVKLELLPLKRAVGAKGGGGYEGISLPDELRGPIANYQEHLYQSPIKTSAGDVHFTKEVVPNYFAHTRIEDIGGKEVEWYKTANGYERKRFVDSGTRRVIELQSDLFQKGRLESEKIRIKGKPQFTSIAADRILLKNRGLSDKEIDDFYKKVSEKNDSIRADLLRREKEVSQLEPYRNTWHERIIREEVKQASKDGKTKLQFPTGETAVKIEGLSQRDFWKVLDENGKYKTMRGGLREGSNVYLGTDAQPEVGMRIIQGIQDQEWIITDVLGEGKFEAVPKAYVADDNGIIKQHLLDRVKAGDARMVEEFDISGKVDQNNPIYKFYEKEVSKYLVNKFGAKRIKDERGVEWNEVTITKEMKGKPVEAFGVVSGVEQDPETGEIKFDPLKALFGIGAAGFARRIGNKKFTTIIPKGDIPISKKLLEISPGRGAIIPKGVVLYHGTFESLVGKITKEGIKKSDALEVSFGKAVYLTDNIEAAKNYPSDFSGAKAVMGVEPVSQLRLYHPTDEEAKKITELFDVEQDTYIKNLLGDNYNGLLIREPDDIHIIAVYDDTLLSTPSRYVPEEDIKLPSTEQEFSKLSSDVQEELFPRLPMSLQKIIAGYDGKLEPTVFDDIVTGKLKMRPPKGLKTDYRETLGQGNYMRIFSGGDKARYPDEVATDMGLDEDTFKNLLVEKLASPRPKADVTSPVVGKTKEYVAISDELKNQITTFFRPSRKQTSRAFSLLGNKDTTVPMFSKIFDEWVKGGTEVIVEPYGGAFTIGTHAIRDAINSGLKEFHSNIFDKEKYLVVKAIEAGETAHAKDLVKSSVKKLSDSIVSRATGAEAEILTEFFVAHPDSYIGSSEFYSFISEKPIASQVTVYRDLQDRWAKLFQEAYNELYKVEPVDLESAIMNAVIKRTGIFGGSGQPLIRQNGFTSFEGKIFGKYGMTTGFDDIATTMKLAKSKGTKISIYNEDGATMIKGIKTDPAKTGYYFDPPYVRSADVYDNADQLTNFASGKALADSHTKAFLDAQNGSKIALTNDVDEEYIRTMMQRVPMSQVYAYKEGATPTSLIVSGETKPIIDKYITEAEKTTHGERQEIAVIKQIQIEKNLSNITMSRARKGLGITELKNAPEEKLDELITFLNTLNENDKFLTPLQMESLKDLIRPGDFTVPINLVTQRELQGKYAEVADVMSGKLTQFISDNLFPTVDIKEKNTLVNRTVNRADAALDGANAEIDRRAMKLDEMLTKAEDSRKALLPRGEKIKRALVPKNEEIFRALGGEHLTLTKEEVAVVAYLKNFFDMARKDLALEKYRKNYITHLEGSLTEKILYGGVLDSKEAFMNYWAGLFTDRGLKGVPLNILLELDNIIGSEKFFKFALPREGMGQPSMNLRKVVNTYSQLYESKKALDSILPEGQAIVQLLLKPRSAKWQKRFLQNLKGRGLDNEFRNGKAGWLARVADGVVDVGYLKLLGLNVWSGAKNLVAGEANSFIVQDFKNYLIGKQRLISNPRKTYDLMVQANLMDGAFYEYISKGLLLSNKKARDIALIFQKAGEIEIRGSLMAGELTEAEWVAGKISPARVREMKDLVALSQGIFTKVDSPLWLQTWYGRLFMQMNRWRFTNFNLIRRSIPKALEEIRNGEKAGKNTMRIAKAFILYGVGMYFSYELAKGGQKQASKVARSMAENINSIIQLMTLKPITDALTDNPSFSVLKELTFTIQDLASYIVPGVEAPKNIEFSSGLGDTYIAPVKAVGDLTGMTSDGTRKKLKPKGTSGGRKKLKPKTL
jgi:hypothetical protein